MALAIGKAALEKLKNYRARGWYIKEFKKFAERVSQEYGERSEVLKGCQIDKGSDTSNRYKCIMDCDVVSTGHVMLKGKMHTVADLTNKDIANADGDQASLAISYGNSGTDPASGVYTITSNSKTFSVRIYNSQAAGEVYDTGSSADIQIDKGHTDSALKADLTLIKNAFDALTTSGQRFEGYSTGNVGGGNGSAATLTITAPVGHGNNLTDNSGSIANLSSSATDAVVDYSGIIYSDGSSASGVDTNSAAAYVTIIATNSDNNGGVKGDGEAVLLLAVVNGTSSSLTQSHASSDQIQSALAASSSNVNGYNHSGVTGWVHLSQVVWNVATVTAVSNLNNHKNA